MHLARGGNPLQVVGGQGARLRTADGQEIVDFTAGAGVVAIGWGRRDVADAVRAQLDQALFVPFFMQYGPWDDFAAHLVRLAPGRLNRAYRATGGSEAVEIGIKAMRAAREPKAIATVSGVFHGNTLAAASAGSGGWDPLLGDPLPGFEWMPSPRDGGWEGVLDELEKRARSSPGLAGFLTEPILSFPGALVPPQEFWDGVAEIREKHRMLIAVDEVVTGFGRCGAMFASELYGIEPDVMCLAKGITSGYAGLGATLVTEEVYQKVSRIHMASTFGWHPVSVAAAFANIDVILKERLWENARTVGAHLMKRLQEMEGGILQGARGKGLLLGMDVTSPDGTHVMHHARVLADECRKRGIIMPIVGDAEHPCLLLTPPLSIDHDTAELGMDRLAEAVRAAEGRAGARGVGEG